MSSHFGLYGFQSFKERKRKDTFFSFSEKDTRVDKRKKEAIPDSPAIAKTNFLSEPIGAGKQAAVCLLGPAHLEPLPWAGCGWGSQRGLGVGETEPALSRTQLEPVSPERTVLHGRDLSAAGVSWIKEVLPPAWVSRKPGVWL